MGGREVAALVFVFALAFFPAAQSHAQPTLHVRAESRVEVHLDGDVVFGVLRDDRGLPLGGRTMDIVVAGATVEPVTTNSRGEFSSFIPTGTTRVAVHFQGDRDHEGRVIEQDVLGRREVSLTIHAEERVDLDGSEFQARIDATGDAGGLQIQLSDENHRVIIEGVTTETGTVEFSLSPEILGAPGAGLLRASILDESVAASDAELPLVRFRQPQLSIRLIADELEHGDPVEVVGHLRDSHGPLPDRAVTMLVNAEPRTTVLTDADGAFTLVTPFGSADVATVEAIYESDGPGHPAARSAQHTVRTRQSLARSWGLVPLLVCLLWLLFWRRARATTIEGDDDHPDREIAPAGIRHAATQRGSQNRTLSGTVVSTRDGAFLVGEIVLRSVQGERRIAVVAGRFAVELEDGEYSVRVEVDAHVPAESTLQVPHRGEWQGAEFRLETWRSRALAVLRRIARGKGRADWNSTTIHELTRDPSVGQVAAEVEPLYYGRDGANEGSLEQLESQAADLTRPSN